MTLDYDGGIGICVYSIYMKIHGVCKDVSMYSTEITVHSSSECLPSSPNPSFLSIFMALLVPQHVCVL